MNKSNTSSDKTLFLESDKGHLVAIVKMRTDALVSYSNRVWAVFNIFQTLNLTFIVAILTKHITGSNPILYFGIISLSLSILWFFLGVNDFLSMERHKRIKNSLEEKFFKSLNMEEELDEDVNSQKRILTQFNFNQTKALFIVPIFNSLISLMIVVNN
jgi:hypothetical protein